MAALTRFLGDSPLRVAIKLIVLSFLAGLVMATFGWSPWDILDQIVDFVRGLWNLGFEAIGRFGSYLLLGAAVVVPAFLILRLLSYRR